MNADGSPKASPALKRLREMTQGHHEALEAALQLDKLQADRARYVELLRRFYALYDALETCTDSATGLKPWQQQMQQLGLVWHERQKLPKLAADLKALGVSPPDPADDPKCRLSFNSLAAVLGSLYVVEGSTLGGQIICRRIGARLHITSESGLAFFSGYGPKTGQMWRQMCDVLTKQLSTAAELDAAVLAAQQTFTYFHNWLVP